MKNGMAALALIWAASLATAAELPETSQNKTITIGLIGKIEGNPIYQAAYAGARVAATELGQKMGVRVVVEHRSPKTENPSEQAAHIRKLVSEGVSGIAVAASDATQLSPVIDEAVAAGIPVLCFDSDAPTSKRMVYIGVDDVEFGRAIMRQLAAELVGKGTVAVLAGNQDALNLRLRLNGIKEEAKQYPAIRIPDELVFEHAQLPDPAIETIKKSMKANPTITGWAIIGTWPLQKKNSLAWKPGSIKAVAGNAVPAELEYVKSGHVQSLVGVNAFQFGYASVETLLEKILKGKSPAVPIQHMPLVPVNSKNVQDWELNWKKWLLKDAVYR